MRYTLRAQVKCAQIVSAEESGSGRDVVITQGAGNVAALAQTLSQLDLSGGAPS